MENNCCQMTNRSAQPATHQHEASRAARSSTFSPAVDIVETPDSYTLTADMPGVDANAVEVDFEDGVLSVRADVPARQGESTRWLTREYGVGCWKRTFRIGEGADPSRIAARCRDGVLTLTVPKAEHARPRRIDVRGG